jgi:hypothetical protein
MSGKQRLGLWVTLAVLLGGAAVAVRFLHRSKKSMLVQGAVIRKDSDPKKELPITDVRISASDELSFAEAKSDSSGFFRLTLPPEVAQGEIVTLQFRHPDYQPLDLEHVAGDELYVVRLVPLPRERQTSEAAIVGNVSVRYSIKATTVMNIASAVKTFQVVNVGNVPCKNGSDPCSPDGKWKAVIASASLDAGEGNEFRNARVSCIAGPCPFTRIEVDHFSKGDRKISVLVRNWSDTTTFLLEAEVVHPTISDIVRRSYPVIFGQQLNFTLPAMAEGVSIQAEIGGETIVFPLGPNLFLSWADCTTRVNNDQTKVYRCELKPGYRFPSSLKEESGLIGNRSLASPSASGLEVVVAGMGQAAAQP